MKECPKCKNNDFQIFVSKCADAKFKEDGTLQAEDNCSEEELIEVNCAKCGYSLPQNKHGNVELEWDWIP